MRRDGSYSATELLLSPLAQASTVIPRSNAYSDVLAEQEPWHQVGMADEPAYATGWYHVAASASTPRSMFRVIERGVGFMELAASHDNDSAIPAGSLIFTLPEGFRPEYSTVIHGQVAYYRDDYPSRLTDREPCDLLIATNGEVSLRRATRYDKTWLSGTRALVTAGGTTGRWQVA